MGKKLKFTLEEEEKIVDFVKNNEVLFNVRHKAFRDVELKNRLWLELANELHVDKYSGGSIHKQRGLKLILKVGSNEYNADSPPTAAEAMMCGDPGSPMQTDLRDVSRKREREREPERKKLKKKKKKRDRGKKHKHHKERRHRTDRYDSHPRESSKIKTLSTVDSAMENNDFILQSPRIPSPNLATNRSIGDCDSSRNSFSFIGDENSQPSSRNADVTTNKSPSCRPVSKPIPIRRDDVLSPQRYSFSQASGGFDAGSIGSPTKPLSEMVILSPATSTQASTSGNTTFATFTSKLSEEPEMPSPSSESSRGPRSCVLKMKQQKSSLIKLLDHLLRFLEKRDPHQFFAWPVTDEIAPGYSTIIKNPMDFSTIRQKIDDNEYTTLIEFNDDFKLMCENAIKYNHVDTVYHKAAKRLLQIGMKHLTPENVMRSLKPHSSFISDLNIKDLGIEINHPDYSYLENQSVNDFADEGASTLPEDGGGSGKSLEEISQSLRYINEPNEPFFGNLTSEEILAQVQDAAAALNKRLTKKNKVNKLSFLRQNNDGTTSLNVLIKDANEGPEKMVSIGNLVGKLKSGSGQLRGLQEDKRNDARQMNSLNYGYFASFAPVFDSRFSNLSKEETKLVLDVYGDGTSAEYAESILQFAKDSPYASKLANCLLDILTQGEHSKAMSNLFDMQVQNYEEQEVLKFFVNSSTSKNYETREQIEEEYEKFKNTRVDFIRLRTLKDIGIDIDFLDDLEFEMKNFELTRRLQEHLSNNLNLIEKLRATQHERLSNTLPSHLLNVQNPNDEEIHIAQQIAQQLTDVAKKLPPSATADSYGLHRAMGISSFVGMAPMAPQSNHCILLPEHQQKNLPTSYTKESSNTTTNLSGSSAFSIVESISRVTNPTVTDLPMNIDNDAVGLNSGVDLENELREFLESGPGGHESNSADDNIVAQLLMN